MSIEPLKIWLYTNSSGDNPIEFTSSTLYHPDYTFSGKLNKYPFIDTSREYPTDVLSYMKYDGVVRFFFDENVMKNTLNGIENNTDTETVIRKNVMTMITYLFATKYYIVNNIHQSINFINNKYSKANIFYKINNTHSSYIKVGSAPHTITKVTWLNDILNHPKYKTLIEDAHKILLAYTLRTNITNRLIELESDKFMKTLDEQYNKISKS